VPTATPPQRGSGVNGSRRCEPLPRRSGLVRRGAWSRRGGQAGHPGAGAV